MADRPHRIQVRLRELAQLFNSMDPSPFHERDLDADAEEFIVSWAREFAPAREFELVIHVLEPPPARRVAAVEEAVRHFFRERATMKRLELRKLLREGRVSLLVGMVFLLVCLVLGRIIGSLGPGTVATVAEEGLTIVGWVAMWRPLQIHLYEWWPLRDEWRILERLSRMKVTLETAEAKHA
jgi:hypothetical protein